MIYSFGHSTYDVDTAADMLRDVDLLIDIRSHPTSKWPQWELAQLRKWVPTYGFSYAWVPELGGWDIRHIPLIDEMKDLGVDITPYTKGFFPKGRISQKLDLPLPAWTVAGFYDFQWFMALPEFDRAVRSVIATVSDKENYALMCAELIPWSCHRSMVADYFLHFYDTDIVHLQPKKQPHSAWKSRMDRYEPAALSLMQQNVNG